jgi:uncharacterized protein
MFEWKMEDHGASTGVRTGADVGGHLNALGHEPHNYTIFYVMVDDVATALAKAVSLGGRKLVGPVPVSNTSEFGWLADPEGNTIGVYAERKP